MAEDKWQHASMTADETIEQIRILDKTTYNTKTGLSKKNKLCKTWSDLKNRENEKLQKFRK